ncbi:unnamed protein product [Cyclocybe aegerita]|uniref:Cytochrome P450 n=1 Tax=Cyclocybe aegerita TaxID=1973307 RepID=A0A8S0W282_CYCAE|nr:unnamed protein product [Cyclocybe aegerita]
MAVSHVSSFIYDTFSNYANYVRTQIVENPLLSLLFVAATPLVVVIINVLQQLLIPKRPSEPPTVFHWFPFIGSALAYGNDPLSFLFGCQEKYGDVFTFILLGRRVTVALGPRGNNFILGGKSTVFNAEDVYTKLTTPVFGKDVVYDVPNEVFMEQKKFIKAGLSTDNLRAYVVMIEDEIAEFLNYDSNFSTYQRNDTKEWGSFDVTKVL